MINSVRNWGLYFVLCLYIQNNIFKHKRFDWLKTVKITSKEFFKLQTFDGTIKINSKRLAFLYICTSACNKNSPLLYTISAHILLIFTDIMTMEDKLETLYSLFLQLGLHGQKCLVNTKYELTRNLSI